MRLSVPIYQLKRRAKLLARDEKIPLHEAQDRIAREEGFNAWSALSARLAANPTASALLPNLAEGDMLLIAARPGQGKTLMGLRLLLDAARDGRRAVFFTLEYNDQQAMQRIHSGNRYVRRHQRRLHYAISIRVTARHRRRHRLSSNPGSAEKQAISFGSDASVEQVCSREWGHPCFHFADRSVFRPRASSLARP